MTPRANHGHRPTPRIPGTPADSTTIAAREAARRAKLPPNPICPFCGYEGLAALRVVPAHLFEHHHVVGRHHDGQLVIVVCANCHAELSIAQLDAGVPLRPQRTTLERMIAVLEMLAGFFRHLADAFIRWARRLHTTMLGLDQDYAAWRTQPWAA